VEASSLSSQKEVQDSAVSRESDGHVFRDVYRVMLVDYTPPGSTINASSCQEILKRLKEAIWKTDQDCSSQGFFCMTVLDLRVLPQL